MSFREDLNFDFERALLSLDRVAARQIIASADPLSTPLQLAERLVTPALERIGKAWEQGRVALSQVYMSGRICEELVNTLLPDSSLERIEQPRIAIATLQDQHALGKRIVYSVMRASGFSLKDFGQGIGPAELVSRVRQERIEVLLISVLMLPSALLVREVRNGLASAEIPARIIVGGAPFTLDRRLWREVGADAMGCYASEAPDLVRQLSRSEGQPS
jgi:trimethylamine corrinoid protein